MRLKDKVAVVLGASAQGGTGWAIAEALAGEGAHVVVGARTLGPLQDLARRIGGVAVRCDAAREDEIIAMARTATDTYGPIDIAVNSAAIPVLGLIADAARPSLQESLDINYLGHVFFVKYMAAAMRDGGSITLVSSNSTLQPILPHFSYACAKAATDCLVRYAALEYGPRGIRVNSIQPGPIKSAMAKHLFELPGVEAMFSRHVPLGRIGLPEDYADTVVFLSGPTYISGVNLPVSGGIHMTGMPLPEEFPQGIDVYVAPAG